MRAELEEHFPADPNLHFVADQALQKLFYQAGKLLPRRVSESTFGLANQILTQLAQRKVVRSLLIPGTVIHQPIPVSPRFPSAMAHLPAALVVGPMNGGMEYPAAFRGTESLGTRALITLGRSFTDAMNTVFCGKRNAALVLVANARTQAALPSGLKGRMVELVENGVDAGQWAPTAAGPTPRFVFIGRLVDWKALDIALAALAQVPGATFDVIGDGPMRAFWQAAAGPATTFHGWKSQAECAGLLAGATALLLPSIYECGGAVALEAMAAAVPVVATAWGGPLDYLDSTCGFLIPPDSREALIAGFTAAIQQLIDDPRLRTQMGAAARARVLGNFTWEQKIDTILSLYQSIV
jgi:glycosyltransferase involved in cell wall biosynthesis